MSKLVDDLKEQLSRIDITKFSGDDLYSQFLDHQKKQQEGKGE